MWILKSELVKRREEVESILLEGFEPFAVTQDMESERLWFKKFLSDLEFEKEHGVTVVREKTKEEKKEEMRNVPTEVRIEQHEPDKGGSGKPTPKSKGQGSRRRRDNK